MAGNIPVLHRFKSFPLGTLILKSNPETLHPKWPCKASISCTPLLKNLLD